MQTQNDRPDKKQPPRQDANDRLGLRKDPLEGEENENGNDRRWEDDGGQLNPDEKQEAQ